MSTRRNSAPSVSWPHIFNWTIESNLDPTFIRISLILYFSCLHCCGTIARIPKESFLFCRCFGGCNCSHGWMDSRGRFHLRWGQFTHLTGYGLSMQSIELSEDLSSIKREGRRNDIRIICDTVWQMLTACSCIQNLIQDMDELKRQRGGLQRHVASLRLPIFGF